MADWGLYSALRGKDDWAIRRQDAALNLQAQQMLTAKRKTENKERMEMEAKLAEYQNTVQNLDVLKADKDRVQQVEKEARQNVIAGIAKYDGDITKYMSSGGVLGINEYQQAVLQSDEYKNAIQNKTQEALWQKDRADKSKFVLSSVIEVDDVDENGKPIKRKKQVTMDEQMALFNSGQINKLNYGGSEEKVKISPELFKRHIKNANDPWSPDNYVTEMDMYNQVVMTHGSQEQARQVAKNYGDGIRAAGTPEAAWRWGAGDPFKLMSLDWDKKKFWASHAQKERALKGNSGGGDGQIVYDVVGNLYRKLIGEGNGSQVYSPKVAEKILESKTRKVSGDEASGITKWGTNQLYSGDVFAVRGEGENLSLSKNVNVSNIAISADKDRAQFITIADEDDVPKVYMIADVYGKPGDENFEQIKTALSEKAFEHIVNENAVDMYGESSGASAQVLIPVNTDMSELHSKIYINKELNIRSNQDDAQLLSTTGEWAQSAMNDAADYQKWKYDNYGEQISMQDAVYEIVNAGSYNAAISGGGNAAEEITK